MRLHRAKAGLLNKSLDSGIILKIYLLAIEIQLFCIKC